MNFLDASILIALAQVNHTHHKPSLVLWGYCVAGKNAVSRQTLSEVYLILTSLPPGLRLTPRDAVLAVETFLKRLTLVELTAGEYTEALRRAANLELAGCAFQDSMEMAHARKANAEHIYTWNELRLQMVAPDLADRITTP